MTDLRICNNCPSPLRSPMEINIHLCECCSQGKANLIRTRPLLNDLFQGTENEREAKKEEQKEL